MTQTSEKSNSSRQLEMPAGEGVDIISNLPDSIIHHILSFLDTQSAVQTCVLSNQWECSWKHVHSLNLELKLDHYRYTNFIDKVLSLRYPLHVRKVSWVAYTCFAYTDGSGLALLKKVVQYAVSHGAQHFNLRPLNRNHSNIALLELFDSISDSVRTLQLVWFDLDCRPVCSGFQLLTTLELYCCRFLTDGELVDPFSQFPCLKDLVLDNCSISSNDVDDQAVRLRVSGLELDRLSLLGISVWKLEIVAPKLKSFRLYFEEYMRFSELILPSLVHADIQSQCWNSTSQDYDVVKQNLVTMFHGLRNVESLTLFDNMSKAVHRISKFLEQHPSPFMKLKKLKLEYWHEDEIPYKVLDSYFLNGSANDGLNIQIQKQGLWQVMIVRRP